MTPETTLQNILSHWDINPTLHTSPHQGLINQTFLVGEPITGVLQWVNPIFDARIHTDIQALTNHLKAKGMPTTELLRTKTGQLYVHDSEKGYWRVLKYPKAKPSINLVTEAWHTKSGKLVTDFMM